MDEPGAGLHGQDHGVAISTNSFSVAGCISTSNPDRARDTRAFIVPTGTRQIAAASSCVSSCAPTRISASRSNGGNRQINCCKSVISARASCSGSAVSSPPGRACSAAASRFRRRPCS